MADTIVPVTNEFQGIAALEASQPAGSSHSPALIPTSAISAPHNTASAVAADSAQLSETAQVSVLQQQGLSVSEIADELGIPQTEVESDLKVVVSAQQTAAGAYAHAAGA